MQNPFAGYDVPEAIKTRVLAILDRFTIQGLCDGMYIANVIAHHTGCGDGAGTFTGTPEFSDKECVQLADILQRSYGCNVFRRNLPELIDILSTGKLDIEKASEGIEDYIDAITKEKQTCKEWRRDYLDRQILKAEETLKRLAA